MDTETKPALKYIYTWERILIANSCSNLFGVIVRKKYRHDNTRGPFEVQETVQQYNA